jgi:hypothetical protein
MNKQLSHILFWLCLLFFNKTTAQTSVQDTVLQETTIEIIQRYKPSLKSTPKPVLYPELPPRDTTPHRFNYNVPQQSLHYTYAALPLKPLTLAKDTVKTSFSNYIKAGAGNLSTLYVDAGIAELKGENYNTYIHLYHLSQQGNIKKQQTSFSGIKASGNIRLSKHEISGSLSFNRNQYFRYGGDENPAVPDYFPELTYTGFKASVGLRNLSSEANLQYAPEIFVSNYGVQQGVQENSFGFILPLSKSITEQIQVGVSTQGIFTGNSLQGKSFSNNVFEITPHLNYRSDKVSLHVSVSPTWAINGKSYVLHNLSMHLTPAEKKFTLSARWYSQLRRNTFEQLSTINPFLSSHYLTLPSKYETFSLGIQTGIGQHLTLSGKIAHLSRQNMPLYVNDTGFRKDFYVQYSSQVKALLFEAGMLYQVADVFSASVTATLYNYYQHSGMIRVWHEPGFVLDGKLSFKPISQLRVSANLQIIDGIYGLNAAQKETALGTIFDLGAEAEYQFIERLSVFLRVNNLLHNQYERWFGYRAYGFNAWGGLRLKF